MEVADEKTPDNASETVENQIRAKEGERILKYVKDDAYVVTLEIKGRQVTSEELADKIDTLGIQGTSHITFIIGGSIGLGGEVLARSDYALSDISTSVDEGDLAGTDLSKLPDHPRRTVSQIKLKDNNEYKIKFPSGYN